MRASTEAILNRWLESPHAEAPYVISGPRIALDNLLTTFQGRQDLELVQAADDTTTLSIAQIQEALGSAAATALTGTRLIVIPGAERLSLPAAAALLKRLEEPTRTTRYLLATRFPRRLLPTIASRCQYLRLIDVAAGDEPSDEIAMLTEALDERLRADGPSVELKRAYNRLRDYHRVMAERGNEKLAREVLLASAPQNKA